VGSGKKNWHSIGVLGDAQEKIVVPGEKRGETNNGVMRERGGGAHDGARGDYTSGLKKEKRAYGYYPPRGLGVGSPGHKRKSITSLGGRNGEREILFKLERAHIPFKGTSQNSRPATSRKVEKTENSRKRGTIPYEKFYNKIASIK